MTRTYYHLAGGVTHLVAVCDQCGNEGHAWSLDDKAICRDIFRRAGWLLRPVRCGECRKGTP